jgi:thioredoxin-dependent peroxiredoxin
MGMPELEPGSTAPPIHLQTDSGETFDLQSARGKNVVLFFYPKADTPGCTTEACEFRDAYAKFGDETLVLGISADTPDKQAKFKEKFGFPYPLLADVDHKVAESYGVWKEKSMYGKKYFGIERTTFLIDTQGKIAKIFHKVKPAGHAEEVLQAL